MLERVEEILKNNYGLIRAIRKIDKSCCYDAKDARYIASNIMVHDYDKIKDTYYDALQKNDAEEEYLKPQSVDALLFAIDKNRLYFIEMKRFDPKPIGKYDCVKFVRKHFEENHEEDEIDSYIPQKIGDSYTGLLELMRYHEIDSKFWRYIKTRKRFRIIPILLSSFTHQELVSIYTGTIDLRNKNKKRGSSFNSLVEIAVRSVDAVDPGMLILNCPQFNFIFSDYV